MSYCWKNNEKDYILKKGQIITVNPKRIQFFTCAVRTEAVISSALFLLHVFCWIVHYMCILKITELYVLRFSKFSKNLKIQK